MTAHPIQRILLPSLAALLLTGGALADGDHDRARRLREAGKVLPLEVILQRVQAEHPGRVIGIELEEEDGAVVYEIELLGERGKVRELIYDATDGRFMGFE